MGQAGRQIVNTQCPYLRHRLSGHQDITFLQWDDVVPPLSVPAGRGRPARDCVDRQHDSAEHHGRHCGRVGPVQGPTQWVLVRHTALHVRDSSRYSVQLESFKRNVKK